MKGHLAPSIVSETGVNITDGTHVIYFFRDSCQACRAITPIVDEMIKDGKNAVKINTDHHFELARKFNIMGTPGLVYIKNGYIVRVDIGAKSRPAIEKALFDVEQKG
jgi:thioredoxin 1